MFHRPEARTGVTCDVEPGEELPCLQAFHLDIAESRWLCVVVRVLPYMLCASGRWVHYRPRQLGKGVPTYRDFKNGSSTRRLLSLYVPRDGQSFHQHGLDCRNVPGGIIALHCVCPCVFRKPAVQFLVRDEPQHRLR